MADNLNQPEAVEQNQKENKVRKERTPRKPTEKKDKAATVINLDSFDGISEVLKETIKNLEKSEKLDIEGKKYTTVSVRVKAIREALGFRIKTESKPIHISDIKVIFEAKISVYVEQNWHIISTGYAEEYRASNEINRKSALENAETSAMGRALANLGLMGSEFASANELDKKQNNISRLKEMLEADKTINQNNLFKKHSIAKIEDVTEEIATKMIDYIQKDRIVKTPNDTNQIDNGEELLTLN